MIFLIVFILAAIWAASRGNKKFIIFFMAFYPILPDYFSIELGGGMPLLKASRILLLILLLCVCLPKQKIILIRKPLKATGLYWPLIIYFCQQEFWQTGIMFQAYLMQSIRSLQSLLNN